MADDWDLFAVVRSCCSSATSSTSSSAPATFSSTAFLPTDDRFLSLPNPFETRPRNEDLRELYKPFFPKPNLLLPISPLSVLGGLHDVSPPPPPPPPPLVPVKRNSVLACSPAVTPSPRSKRRKIQKKMVCQVAAEDLSSDTWSWRKYGQKPIKGSPYPRGYYKCSTSKGCLARKQVERNRSDPGMFIVTYTADHNHPMPTHRSSFSGVSRLKPDDLSATPTTTATEKREKVEEETEDFPEPDEEEDEFDGSDMVVGDDFFEGLEDFTGDGDYLSVNKAASPAGGGG